MGRKRTSLFLFLSDIKGGRSLFFPVSLTLVMVTWYICVGIQVSCCGSVVKRYRLKDKWCLVSCSVIPTYQHAGLVEVMYDVDMHMKCSKLFNVTRCPILPHVQLVHPQWTLYFTVSRINKSGPTTISKWYQWILGDYAPRKFRGECKGGRRRN